MSSCCRIELPFKLNWSNADFFSAPIQRKRIRSLRIESIALTKPMLCNNNSLVIIRWANPLSFVVCCLVSIVKRNEFAFSVCVCEWMGATWVKLTVWQSGYWMRCDAKPGEDGSHYQFVRLPRAPFEIDYDNMAIPSVTKWSLQTSTEHSKLL